MLSSPPKRAMKYYETAMTDETRAVRQPKRRLRIHSLEHQRGVGTAEAERVRKHCSEFRIVDAFAHDRHIREYRIEFGDVGAFADESILHHQKRIDRLLYAGGAQRMAGQRFGCRNRRALVAGPEYLADRLDFRRVARRR